MMVRSLYFSLQIFFTTFFFLSSFIRPTFIYGQETEITEEKDKKEDASQGHLESELLPINLLLLDEYFTHHVLVAEKSTHLLHLFENKQGFPRLIKSYQMATGKSSGDKSNQGDLKTPEGIYTLKEFLSAQVLQQRYASESKKYGVGAFILNYPNVMDLQKKKTGNGIWLHATDDESRITKGLDSQGCVVISGHNLVDVARYILLPDTPIIIVQDLLYVKKKTWETLKQDLTQQIQKWISAWMDEDLSQYASFYHPQQFRDPQRKTYQGYLSYKKQVFSKPGKPHIRISHLSIMTFEDYSVVHLLQDYRSDAINDIGKKTLYLKKDDQYSWKIVSEVFQRSISPTNEKTWTQPEHRYFP
jgi:murein L,D-transpeptidase YafK